LAGTAVTALPRDRAETAQGLRQITGRRAARPGTRSQGVAIAWTLRPSRAFAPSTAQEIDSLARLDPFEPDALLP
jgi:hypothetical protein